MKFKMLWLILIGSFSVCFNNNARTAHKFIDFPLEKVDFMYKEQGGPIAGLVFDLWVCTNQFIKEDLNTITVYYNSALPSFKKLNTFKRFIDELCIEWTTYYNKKALVPFFQKMFSRNQGKAYLENLTLEEFHDLLHDLRSFLWDVAHNAPYAREKCIATLHENQKKLFESFLLSSCEE